MIRLFLLATILLLGFSQVFLVAAESPATTRATFAVY